MTKLIRFGKQSTFKDFWINVDQTIKRWNECQNRSTDKFIWLRIFLSNFCPLINFGIYFYLFLQAAFGSTFLSGMLFLRNYNLFFRCDRNFGLFVKKFCLMSRLICKIEKRGEEKSEIIRSAFECNILNQCFYDCKYRKEKKISCDMTTDPCEPWLHLFHLIVNSSIYQ